MASHGDMVDDSTAIVAAWPEKGVTKMVAGCDVEGGLRTHIDAILTLRHEVEIFLSLAQINHLSYTFQSPSRIYFPLTFLRAIFFGGGRV